MAENTTSECSSPAGSTDTDDKEFEPSADMLVHDFDDERTMEEEEECSDESCGNELDDLQKNYQEHFLFVDIVSKTTVSQEGDMPLEELLAMYGYGANAGSACANGAAVSPPDQSNLHDTRSSSEEEILSNQDLTLDKDEIARDLLKNDVSIGETSVTALLNSVDVPSKTNKLLKDGRPGADSDNETDSDYEPLKEEHWKKFIQTGADYQATVPEGFCKYGDIPGITCVAYMFTAYENPDSLLWDPHILDEQDVEGYLRQASAWRSQSQPSHCSPTKHSSSDEVTSSCSANEVHDDEQALYLLQRCGHNVEEALRRRRMQAVPTTDAMSLWSEDECRNFEHGLRTYGKDFHLIQQTRVRTRSVGELVHFYYLWKKTERHDMFTNKYRMDSKKRFNLQPGSTDYMDRFLDDQENVAPPRDTAPRPSSPSIHSLIYGDHKRHTPNHAHSNPAQRAHNHLDQSQDADRADVTSSSANHVSPLRGCEKRPAIQYPDVGGASDTPPLSKRIKLDAPPSPVTVSRNLVNRIAADLDLNPPCINDMSHLIDSSNLSLLHDTVTSP